ncbi:GNAT family N-acetyltransferase [Treponema bryantii]|uniref:GNAT family N-acetyltransferase n=1 Tax=Treponema bryantii TaxID=163 RepID=UPI0003B6C6A2|nr:GNAT family N-acetyltransferase [Treponema bryantii]
MNTQLKIRDADINDAERLVEIYAPYITETAVSFEYDVPTVDEFKERIKNIKEKYPYLVCEKDGNIVGYVYASAYSKREAYDWTVGTSIYVDKKFRRMGIGSLLYSHLEEELKKIGIENLLAGVAYCEREDPYLTKDSYKFHLREGYVMAGHLKDVGKKFDRYYDLLWMQKKI